MIRKSWKRSIRFGVWSFTALLVLAFFPAPVDGNWILLPPSARNHCGCDSHDFTHYAGGSAYDVHGNHPPPTYLGPYRTTNWGCFDGTVLTPRMSVAYSGVATLLFAFEFSCWGSNPEFNFYLRDVNPRASRAVHQQTGMFAQRFGSLFSVIRNKEGRTVILKRQNAEIALDDVDALAEKYYKDKVREIIVQTDLPESEVQPLVSKLESHGFSVRVKPQIPFP